jgi:hypothetical protein
MSEKWTTLRRWLPAAVIAVVCLLIACASLEIQGLGYDYRSETFLSSLPQDSTREYWLRLYRVIEILNDSLAKRLQYLDVTMDSSTIDSLVDRFKRGKDFLSRPDTPNRNEWWNEIWNIRAAHCDSFYHTPFLNDHWDRRARPVIILGIPELEYKSPCPGMATCWYYFQEWPRLNTYITYRGVNSEGPYYEDDPRRPSLPSFAPISEGKYLTAFVDHDEKFDAFGPVDKTIKAAVDIVSFPDSNGYTLWISSGVGVQQYVPDSSKIISFHQQVAINLLSDEPRLVYSDSTATINLPLPDSAKHLRDYWYPVYLGGCNLPGGTYDVFVSLYDDHSYKHHGAYRTNVTLPSPRASKGMSDIVIALKPAAPVFEEPGNRIVRGNYALMGNPAYYHGGDTIYPYVEFDAGNFRTGRSGQYEFTVLASLYRAQQTFGKPSAEIGKVLEVEFDTTDTKSGGKYLRQPQRKTENLIFSTSMTVSNRHASFHAPVILPDKLSSGRYFLVISAQDALSRNYLTSWREIKIKK